MTDLGSEDTEQSTDGYCPSCKDGNHEHHRPMLAGICIGCSCPYRPEAEDEYASADGGFATVESEERPSQILGPDDLDLALLLLVVGPDGKTRLWVEPTVDPGQLAKGLRRTAKHLERSRARTLETVKAILDPE